MRNYLFGLSLALGACVNGAEPDPTPPPVPTPVDPYTIPCETETVTTVIYARFFEANGNELTCQETMARGISIEVGPIGGLGEDIAEPYLCMGTLADPAHRFLQGTFKFDVPRYTARGVRLVDADSVPVSVESFVSHNPDECKFGVADKAISFVILPSL